VPPGQTVAPRRRPRPPRAKAAAAGLRAAQNRERKDHVSILVGAVGASKLVGDRPDEATECAHRVPHDRRRAMAFSLPQAPLHGRRSGKRRRQRRCRRRFRLTASRGPPAATSLGRVSIVLTHDPGPDLRCDGLTERTRPGAVNLTQIAESVARHLGSSSAHTTAKLVQAAGLRQARRLSPSSICAMRWGRVPWGSDAWSALRRLGAYRASPAEQSQPMSLVVGQGQSRIRCGRVDFRRQPLCLSDSGCDSDLGATSVLLGQ